MKRIAIALAVSLAAGAAFADQRTNATVNGVFQSQSGFLNEQRMNVGSITSATANVQTNVVANQLRQTQTGNRNYQRADIGSVHVTRGTPISTNVHITGTVQQLQGGTLNDQRLRIGSVY